MKKKLYTLFIIFAVLSSVQTLQSQNETYNNPFKQLKDEMATPNVYRTASGAPGHEYWQQKADYNIQIELDDQNHRIHGTETITYTNNSPDELSYLWLQLDQNVRAQNADSYKVSTDTPISGIGGMSDKSLLTLHNNFEGGFNIEYIKDKSNRDLPYTINQTMLRIDLPQTLKSQNSVSFQVKWWYNINDRINMGGRSGYEYFEKDDNYAYTIAQFYPRMAVYNDYEGWQNMQFLGNGEFAVPFGDFNVSITLPADFVVAATGELQNSSSVLTSEQRNRLQKARTSTEPVLIITQAEAEANESSRSNQKKTWQYKANNVRDFAIAASRKFLWDAMGVPLGGKTVMAQSLYPKEGNPLWGQYSTRVVAHTLRSYSKHTFDYPYPSATSVHAKAMGMEYPMICFNFGRPDEDGTYAETIKFRMIGVIIHEVGHNFFPMIVNSDERQWAWMDEGLNTFLQYLTEQEWERGFPSRRGPAYKIVDYMKATEKAMVPIMSSPNTVPQLGNNAYGKPATALNILRETVMGRELFDFAFKTYAQRWKFKHPSPEDFFRTMEDASAVDLDWFWRGWFYSTKHVDIALKEVNHFQVNTLDPEIENPLAKAQAMYLEENYISNIRNKTAIPKTVVEKDPQANDFYNEYDKYAVSDTDKTNYEFRFNKVPQGLKEIMAEDWHYYEITFSNIGGLVMPLILQFEYADKTTEIIRIPAEIWQLNATHVTKIFPREKEVIGISLDPYFETADTDTYNNYWPARPANSRFSLFKERERLSNGISNPMKENKKQN
ncbi:MAG: M1 family metallopeptidase [Chitinophagales bacterium]